MSWVERQASRTRSSRVGRTSSDRAPGADLPDVVLDVALEAQPTDDEPGDDGDGETRGHVGDRDGRAEQAPQENDRDLVDHRRGDEEREGHAERDADLDEADEQWHGRAGAERA